jgi:hypothetical protein
MAKQRYITTGLHVFPLFYSGCEFLSIVYGHTGLPIAGFSVQLTIQSLVIVSEMF